MSKRKKVMDGLFSKEEMTAILNALSRRTDDNRTEKVNGENELRLTCHNIFMELMR